MLELALSDEVVTPRVELLDGPRVRLTISASENIAHGLEFCRAELIHAVEVALQNLLEANTAPARIFIRSMKTDEIITTIDPEAIYGSNAIVRP
ncbi:unannotated protein [freshwater metagenome]|jgi:hypothetical protein|uniref:Unannotated protein n=1 Tax=freshwater metagenome TaxID=449393 RepID=A0A6J5ZBX3_9ZZZZ|nr:hypothetical protein [Actinomycetota bacterium]MSW24826.1 hypothetical protein [Actinomycetota bacterium]MSX29560.1 hypothetical protein [Actinomycetota bacterium]MSX43931.1 hypothetical protein [Actinomycetota bacterium]MSX97891.1 hypothetical protein [Actinomycetota bacterium]